MEEGGGGWRRVEGGGGTGMEGSTRLVGAMVAGRWGSWRSQGAATASGAAGGRQVNCRVQHCTPRPLTQRVLRHPALDGRHDLALRLHAGGVVGVPAATAGAGRISASATRGATATDRRSGQPTLAVTDARQGWQAAGAAQGCLGRWQLPRRHGAAAPSRAQPRPAAPSCAQSRQCLPARHSQASAAQQAPTWGCPRPCPPARWPPSAECTRCRRCRRSPHTCPPGS